jgi:ribonuclease HII
VSNYDSGHPAEIIAADYLITLGFKILDINWKTKYCEIDIVAVKKKRVYFVEVKSRSSTHSGTGFEYITSKKLNQMKFAAEM